MLTPRFPYSNYQVKPLSLEKEQELLHEFSFPLRKLFFTQDAVEGYYLVNNHIVSLAIHGHSALLVLPIKICLLSELKTLDVAVNGITWIPPEIGMLKHLEVLNLEKNHITELPNTLIELPALKEINLENNPLSAQALDVLFKLERKGVKIRALTLQSEDFFLELK